MIRSILSILFGVYFVVCMLILLVIAAVLRLFTFPFDRYAMITNRSLWLLAVALLRINPGWSVTIEGADKYAGGRPTVFVGNHQSYFDLPLTYMLPWKMKWVAKKELFQIPFLGWLVWLTGHLSVDRGKRSAIKRLGNLEEPLEDNVPVMIFPEGTRSPDGDLKRFKSGAFLLAKRNGYLLQPMVLDGGHRVLPPGSWKLRFKQRFHLSVLDPVDPKDFDSIDELKKYTWDLIQQELQRIRKLAELSEEKAGEMS